MENPARSRPASWSAKLVCMDCPPDWRDADARRIGAPARARQGQRKDGAAHRQGKPAWAGWRGQAGPEGPANTGLAKPGCAAAACWPRASLAVAPETAGLAAQIWQRNARSAAALPAEPALAVLEPEPGSGERQAFVGRESRQCSQAAMLRSASARSAPDRRLRRCKGGGIEHATLQAGAEIARRDACG